MSDYDTGIDWSDCSIVERNPRKMGGLPTVRAYRMPADQVVENFDYGLSADEIADEFSLPLDDVRIILAYAEKFRQNGAHLS